MPASESLAVAQPPTADWGDLIERVAARDEAALAELYDGTSALVHGLALRIVGDAHAAEEVTMDVYLQIWRQAGRSLRPGDFHRADRGTTHGGLFSETGCLLLIVESRKIAAQ